VRQIDISELVIETYAKLSIEQTFSPQKNPSTLRPHRQVHFCNTLDARALNVFALLQLRPAARRVHPNFPFLIHAERG
jgi:hypothetical protein